MKKSIQLLLFSLVLILASACSNTKESASQNNSKGGDKEAKVESKFPEKPIKMIVPFAPGSINDNSARLLAKLAEKHLPHKESITIENVEGGGGIIGMTQLMNAKPDGYTIAYGTVSHVSVLPHFGEASFTHDSFQPIMKNTASIPMLVVRTDSKWNTFEDWLKFAQENPGKFSYATTGPGSISNLNMVAVAEKVGVKVKNVPYEGGAQGITALLGGHIDGAVVMPSDALEHIKAGTLKPLIVFGTEKTEYDGAVSLTDLKMEGGIEAFSMLFAPKKISKTELSILDEAFHKAQQDPEYVDYVKNSNSQILYLDPSKSQAEATRTFELAGDLLKKLGIIK
ncbi:Bug family tripartite tricarboxylate transporter substrate binding protein [Neobacillus citreus]|uniref:Tripartite tricarboxylate transporter substrate binding protein n=1 Tax=Neobacillus citreus TaxID=2833578 RepID=A0A942T3K0_9BACI|nr:tripartite tricarboxylate transporter substrate binding protein [Neobacillus citreus]MCH6264236.1 tripartite tricarboxylate transporter substrate binding protein [Neobacillus citreus]